jgi:hypothetical protein
MDFWTNCTQNASVCNFGILLGVIITLILMWIYFSFFKKSEYLDYGTISPQAQMLVNRAMMNDPNMSMVALNALGAKPERFVSAGTGSNGPNRNF